MVRPCSELCGKSSKGLEIGGQGLWNMTGSSSEVAATRGISGSSPPVTGASATGSTVTMRRGKRPRPKPPGATGDWGCPMNPRQPQSTDRWLTWVGQGR
jgi:hypothetical protein